MSELITRLAERLSPEEIEELSALLVIEAGEILTFIICDPPTGKEVSRKPVKLCIDNADDRAIMEGLGVIREIVFDL